jgi:hypothetical protein
MLLAFPFNILVRDSNSRDSVRLEHAVLYPRGWAYAAANHQNKRDRQLWSLISEKTGIMASERTRLMTMIEIMCVRRTGKDV